MWNRTDEVHTFRKLEVWRGRPHHLADRCITRIRRDKAKSLLRNGSQALLRRDRASAPGPGNSEGKGLEAGRSRHKCDGQGTPCTVTSPGGLRLGEDRSDGHFR